MHFSALLFERMVCLLNIMFKSGTSFQGCLHFSRNGYAALFALRISAFKRAIARLSLFQLYLQRLNPLHGLCQLAGQRLMVRLLISLCNFELVVERPRSIRFLLNIMFEGSAFFLGCLHFSRDGHAALFALRISAIKLAIIGPALRQLLLQRFNPPHGLCQLIGQRLMERTLCLQIPFCFL